MTQFREDPWASLRSLTSARIALGSAGAGLPTARHLEFQLAHARARDAVHHPMNLDLLEREIELLDLPVLRTRSAARDRASYLQRPDLGRRLSAEADAQLSAHRGHFDAVFVVGDGLSARGVEASAPALLRGTLPALRRAGWSIGPVVLAEQARVALGDEIAAAVGATMVAVLIGERPGLSAPDSLGIYLTYGPATRRTDAERNCISNVRNEGLPAAVAAHRLTWLMQEARRRRLTGVGLREEAPALPQPEGSRELSG